MPRKSNLVILLLFAAAATYGLTHLAMVNQDDQPMATPQISIDKSTTDRVEPLDESGYVDYLQAVNQQLHLESVTPEHNYALALWQILGVDSVPKSDREAFFGPISFRFDPDSTLPQWKSSDAFFQSYTFDSNRQLRKSVSFFDAPLKPWQGADFPAIESLLAENKRVLDYLAEEMTRTEFAQPYVSSDEPKLISAQLYGILELKEICRMFALRAMLRQGKGDLENAFKDSLSCMRVCQYLTQRSSGVEITFGLEVCRWSTEVEKSILADGSLSKEQMLAHLDDLLKMKVSPEIAKTFGGVDRWMVLEIAQLWDQQFPNAKLPPTLNQLLPSWATPLSVDIDESMLVVNKWYDRGVESLSGDTHESIVSEISKIYRDIGTLEDSLNDRPERTPEALGRYIGRILVTQLFSDLQGFYLASVQTQSQQRMVITAYALRLYHREHNSYPDNLEALVSESKLDPNLIIDPYCEKPFRFEIVDGQSQLMNSPPDERPWQIELPKSS